MEIVTLQAGTKLAQVCKLVSKKRKAILASPTEKVTISGSYWDGGSRSEYFLVDLHTMRATPIPGVAPVQFGGPREDPVVNLAPHQAVVCAGTFCGKPATPTVYFHPQADL
jgi:hypothetical protein